MLFHVRSPLESLKINKYAAFVRQLDADPANGEPVHGGFGIA
jgi:hypothetical protein